MSKFPTRKYTYQTAQLKRQAGVFKTWIQNMDLLSTGQTSDKKDGLDLWFSHMICLKQIFTG